MSLMPDLTMTPRELYEKSYRIGYDQALVDIAKLYVSVKTSAEKAKVIHEFLFANLSVAEKDKK